MMETLQRRSQERFQELGWPTKRTPGYVYVPLRRFPSKPLSSCPTGPQVEGLPREAIALSLEQAMKPYGSFLKSRWMRSLKEEDDPFAALNGAEQKGGLFLYVPPGVQLDRPIEIRAYGDAHPRVHLFVGAKASVKLQLWSRFDGWLNPFFDAAVEEGATLQVALQSAGMGESPVTEAFRASLKARAKLTCVSLSEGAAPHRQDYRVDLHGEEADARLSGVWMLDGSAMHTRVLIKHHAASCTSTQTFKGVLKGAARSSFSGKIFVEKEAQKTDAVQMNHNLLLSDGAVANSRPDLEIFADDVKCTHGSTTGQLDLEALLYLRTRGISEPRARSLLTCAFVEDVLNESFASSGMLERVQSYLRAV